MKLNYLDLGLCMHFKHIDGNGLIATYTNSSGT
ncbi:hypothetical protein F442_19168, partial [Phytophthora nicotianae P10297]